MIRKVLVAAAVATMFGSTAQAGGPLLPRVQAGLKQLPALTAPVVATTRGVTSSLARPALSRPMVAAALPGLSQSDVVAKAYYYPAPDPGSGSDWLTYNVKTWYGKRLGPYAGNITVVAAGLSADLTAQVLAAQAIVNPGPCDCSGGGMDLTSIGTRAQNYVATILAFGTSRAAGLTTKIGPPPLPKRPDQLSGLTPLLVNVSTLAFGPAGPT